MNVALVTAHLSRAAGGVAESILGFSRALNAAGTIHVRIFGILDDRHSEDHLAWGPNVEAFRALGPRAFGWAPKMQTAIAEYRPSVVDAQGLWMYPSLASLRQARIGHSPYVITVHGMLDPWALSRAWCKKRAVFWWFERDHLHGAACLRAVSKAEVRAIRGFGLRNPVALVPNGVELPAPSGSNGVRGGPRTLLFLGRIDPKKGISELLRAWASVQSEARRNGWRLQVTGWGAPVYLAQMDQLADELALDPTSFALTEPRFGDAKAQTFEQAAAFVLPSHSEGLPMAVLEAWSHELPALLTDACNLPEGFMSRAALRIEPRPEAIAQGIRALFTMDDASRRCMGRAGRRLVEDRFTWHVVAEQMRDVYEWLVGGGSPPPCVLTD